MKRLVRKSFFNTKFAKTERTQAQKDQIKELEWIFDRIIETNDFPDFVEIIGKMGGDTITYRIYKDGSITER